MAPGNVILLVYNQYTVTNPIELMLFIWFDHYLCINKTQHMHYTLWSGCEQTLQDSIMLFDGSIAGRLYF